MVFPQDQLFVPFPRLMAFQPAIPGVPSTHAAITPTAALHLRAALPHRFILHPSCIWEWTRQLD